MSNHRSDSDLEKSVTNDVEFNSESHIEENEVPVAPKSRGITHIEAVKDSMGHVDKGRLVTYLFCGSILITAWAYALDGSTTYNYQPYATSSFNRHSMLSTLAIATSLMAAICKPFIAKFSDLTSRPVTYILVLFLYVVGTIIVACSPNISAYVVGASFISVGSSGLSLLNSIVVADLSPLKWRGFMTAMLSTPYIINTWFSGLIVSAVVGSNWRWGYGMFAIIMPVTLSPAIGIMLWLDHKANKEGKISLNAYGQERQVLDKNWAKTIKNALIEIDAFGLILLGFGFSLLLLPFSLYYYAENGFKNPSMIAMFVTGGVILILFTVYEIYFAPFPSMPKRIVFNRTFISAVVIDCIYMLAGYIFINYWSSYAYVITDWSVQNWTYYNNTLTMGLCVFGVVAGAYHRIFHRYKYLQISGLCIKTIAYGVFSITPANTAVLVIGQIMVGVGGAFSVVSSQVAAQASVPHQDLGTVISLLSLWSSVFASIGSAISAVIWSSKMPQYLREYMPASVNDTQVLTFYSDITTLRLYDMDSPIRQAGISAYYKTMYYMINPALGISFVSIIAGFFQTNYYLGDQNNAVEGEQPEQYPEQVKNEGQPRTFADRVAFFFNKPAVAENN